MAIFEKTIQNKKFDQLLFKVNTLGEESFLEDVKGLLEEILEE